MHQMAQRADHVIHAFARHHPAKLEDDMLVGVQPQVLARRRLADRLQFLWVEARRNHRDPLGSGVVQGDQVVPVLRALRDDAVCLRCNLLFNLEAHIGKFIILSLVLPPHAPQRVEGDGVGYAQLTLNIQRHQTRHPKVGVDEVIRSLAADEVDHKAGEVAHVGQHFFFADIFSGPRRYVNDAHAVFPREYCFQFSGVAAGEYVHLVAQRRQIFGNLRHVDVLPSVIYAPQCRDRGSVLADDCNSSHSRSSPIKLSSYPKNIACVS